MEEGMNMSGEFYNDEVRLGEKSRASPSSPLFDDDFQPKRTGTLTVRRKIYPDNSNNGICCPFCTKNLKTKKLLVKHKATCSNNPSKLPKFPCEKCNMQFTRKDSLKKHVSLNRCSATLNKKTKPRHLCLFNECSFKSWHKTDLIQHLKDSHSGEAKILPQQNFKFDNWAHFINWKDEEEKQQYSYFSEQYGKKDGHSYFYCQQDGPRRAKINSKSSSDLVEGENSEDEDSSQDDGPAFKRRKRS